MPRLLPIVLLLLPALASFAVEIAPLPELPGPIAGHDEPGTSATNGQSTLVAWTNVHHGASAWIRLMDTPQETMAINIGGKHPALATNGEDYLVAWSADATASHQPYLHESLFVQLIRATGELGARRTLVVSTASPAVTGAVWNGERWLVAYDRTLEILDADLNRVTIDAGDTIRQLAQLRGSTWLLLSNEVVEVLPGGTFGRRHSAQGVSRLIPTADGAALGLTAKLAGIEIRRLDPHNGFSTSNPLLDEATYLDAEPFAEGIAVVYAFQRDERRDLELVTLDATGAVSGHTVLLEDVPATTTRFTLGEGRGGLVLFMSEDSGPAVRPTGFDLYRFRLSTIGPLDRNEAELVSEHDFAVQARPVIASDGTRAMAFWLQTRPDGSLGLFSRPVGADGMPDGDAIGLPITLPTWDRPRISFDGERFFLTGSNGFAVWAAAISRDGRSAGPLMTLGEGADVAIASSSHGTFVVWVRGQVLRGTPLREDATPVIPGGFDIQRPFGTQQDEPGIAAVGDGFVILLREGEQDVRTIAISPSGGVRSSSVVGSSRLPSPIAGARSAGLAAWLEPDRRPTLFTIRVDGQPGVPLNPWPWPEAWIPHQIVRIDDRRFIAVLSPFLDTVYYTSIITIDDGVVRDATPLRLLGQFFFDLSVTSVDGRPIALYPVGRHVKVTTGPSSSRRRSVRP